MGDEKVWHSTFTFHHRKQSRFFRIQFSLTAVNTNHTRRGTHFFVSSPINQIYSTLISSPVKSTSNCKCALSVKQNSIAAEKLGGVTGVCRPWMQPATRKKISDCSSQTQAFFTVFFPPVESVKGSFIKGSQLTTSHLSDSMSQFLQPQFPKSTPEPNNPNGYLFRQLHKNT